MTVMSTIIMAAAGMLAAHQASASETGLAPSDGLARAIDACWLWTGDPATRSRGPAEFPDRSRLAAYGLRETGTVPEFVEVPPQFGGAADLARFRMAFAGGDLWIVLSTATPGCTAAVTGQTVLAPPLRSVLGGGAFPAVWTPTWNEDHGAVVQQSYVRNDRPSVFALFTYRTEPAPKGSNLQMTMTMADRDPPARPVETGE